MSRFFTLLSLFVLTSGFVTGCGSKTEKVIIPPNQPLEDVALLVKRHMSMHNKPPAKLQDLNALEPEAPVGFHELIRGTCVLIYGVPISDAPGSADKVLAYEKDATTQGGYVLMQDGNVKKMTAAEFQAAPKAEKAQP